MRTNAIVRIVLYSLAILVLVSILAGALLLKTFIVDTDWGTVFTSENTGTVASVGSVSANEIRNIQVEWAAGTITLEPGDVTEITFSETSGLAEEDRLIWSQKGDKLLIQFVKQYSIELFNSISTVSKDLKITVPRDWICNELEIDAASAEVHVSQMTINEVDFDGASGICTFSDCHVTKMDVDTASGDIRYSGTLSELDCDAASATCTLQVTNCPRRIDADMMSGDLRLTLPESCGFTVKMEALSSNFTSDFPTTTQNGRYIYGGGNCVITVSAISGDVIIYKGSAAE